MPYRRIFFEKHQPVHIVSRAVEKIKIFQREEDCYRFIFLLYTLNIGRRPSNLKGKDIIKASQALLNGEEIPFNFVIKEHPPWVYFLDFSLVVDHYHLCLLPNVENIIPLFMQKLNNGFAKYFNLKHEREGALFGRRYKSILIKTDSQFDAVSRYISVINPLDVYQPGWREKGLRNWEDAFRFLEGYQFSSFPERLGKRRSKILAPPEIIIKYSFSKYLQDKEECRQFVKDFLKQKLASHQPLFLE
jgi:hypothetical protein